METKCAIASIFIITSIILQPLHAQQQDPTDTKAVPADAHQNATKAQPATASAPVAPGPFSSSPQVVPASREPRCATGQLSDYGQVVNVLTEIQDDIATLKQQNWVKDLGPSVIALLVLFVTTIISVISLNRNAQLAREALQSKAHEEERKAIREKRDRFYGPFTQLRGISLHLYDIFNARRSEEERSIYADADGKFRTLIALCKGHAFTGIDKVLLDEIVRIGDESASLITKEIGLVDNASLQLGLSRAAAHYRIIKLAAKGKLASNGDEFERFTFPHDVDRLIARKIDELDARLRQLELYSGSTRPASNTAGQSL